jgi:hypothetical protein
MLQPFLELVNFFSMKVLSLSPPGFNIRHKILMIHPNFSHRESLRVGHAKVSFQVILIGQWFEPNKGRTSIAISC